MNRFSSITMALCILLSCSSSVVSATNTATIQNNNERQLQAGNNNDPLLDNWEKEEGLANMINEMIESSKTKSPSYSPTEAPTDKPSKSPTKRPTQTPTSFPSSSPTESMQPSNYPSVSPTVSPSAAPSISAYPTAAPSIHPSASPTDVPSMSQVPTVSPSGLPSNSPTASPSSPPSETVSPSESPSRTMVMNSSVVIEPQHRRGATPLLIVGAACFIVLASTSAYLHQRGSTNTKKRKFTDFRGRAPTMIVDITSPDKRGWCGLDSARDDIISPYSVEDGFEKELGGRDLTHTFDPTYSKSDDKTFDYGENKMEEEIEKKKNEICLESNNNNNDEMVDVVDLETGQMMIIGAAGAVPNSVSIINTTTPPKENANEHHQLASFDENESVLSSMLRMPRSIYIPKLFHRGGRGGTGGENSAKKKSSLPTWTEIRDQGGQLSPASSGMAPASVPSPNTSPFFVKGLSSLLTPRGSNIKSMALNDNENNSESKGKPWKKAKKNDGAITSSINETEDDEGQPPSPGDHSDVFANLEHAKNDDLNELDNKDGRKCNKSSDTSCVTWGTSSKATFNENMTELQNILVSIKSLGGSDEQEASGGANLEPNSSSSTYSSSMFGQYRNMLSKSGSADSSNLTDPPVQSFESGITYQQELMKAKSGESGMQTFSFKNIFNDPKNDVYECHAPSGPLGIVVDTTPLGPRVRSLNPLSPIFGKISPGDVIVGVDDTDTVGMEAGEFWQLASRKANQQRRILTILRI